jgi:hypothetical protein
MDNIILAKSNRGVPDPVGLHDSEGVLINPATEDTLLLLKTALESIKTSIENIDIDADNINLNTDDLEEKLDFIISALGIQSGTDILTEVQSLVDLVTNNVASEITLGQIKTGVDNIYAKLDVALSTRASELTLGSVKSNLDDIKTKLDTLNAKDFSTQTTLALIKSAIDNIYVRFDVALSSRATENTSQAILSALGTQSGSDIVTELNNILSVLNGAATESTLIEIKNYLDTVETKLQSLIDKNQAKETGGNLDTIKSNTDKLDTNLSTRLADSTYTGRVGEVQTNPTANTLLARLKDIWDRLATYLTVKLYDKDANGISSKDEGSGVRSLDVNVRSGSGSGYEVVGIKDSANVRINPAKEDGNLLSIKTDLDNIYARLDVALSTRASEVTVGNIYSQLNITLSSLRDSITGVSPNNKTLKDINDTLLLIKAKTDNLDVALSTRATESTLALIKAKTDNLDVLLSSRLSETTFTGRVGEVQITPTQYTVLARLKDLWDKLHDLFVNGVAKVKIWDGTYQAAITSSLKLKVENFVAPDYYPSYVGKVLGSTAGANKFHANIFNGVASGYIVKIYKIEVVNYTDALATGHNISFQALRSSNTGTGTTTTIAMLDTSNAAVPVGVTMRETFTVSPTVSDSLAAGNLDTEESRSGSKCILFAYSDHISPIILREGQGLAIRQEAYASGGKISIYIYFHIVGV